MDEPSQGEDQASGAGKTVDARHAQGVQIGDNPRQTNYYTNVGLPTSRDPRPPVLGEVESPYCGLFSFEERNAAFFFGQDAATEKILGGLRARAEEPALLIVTGVSGAGKSSLLQAGVLPRLGEAAPDGAVWPHLTLSPARSPLRELAARTARMMGKDAATLHQTLREDPASFALAALEAAGTAEGSGAAGRLLLVVDQFEQVFTQCGDENERRAFITALHAAATVGHGPRKVPAAVVILTVRADYEARCADYEELVGAVQENRYFLPRMTESQLRLAITEPARVAGASVDDALVSRLVETALRTPEGAAGGTGVLPHLSHALDQAWRDRIGDVLTLNDYERTGGIEGSIGASADHAYCSLTPAQQEIARQVFTRLAAASDSGAVTGDRASIAELTEGKDPEGRADVRGVLDAFAERRLLTITADSVELSHETLLTAWPLLRDTWLAGTRADLVVRTQLRTAAAAWDGHDRNPAYLYRGLLLQAADETAGRVAADPARHPPLSSPERDFLRASSRAQRRYTRLWQAAFAIVAVLALVASGLAAMFNQQRDEANQRLNQATASQIEAEVQAGHLTTSNPSLAAQLIRAAYQLDPSNPDLSEQLMLTEHEPLPTPLQTLDGGSVDAVAFSPDGRTLAVGDDGGGGETTLWNITGKGSSRRLGQPLSVPDSGGVNSVAFSPDGRTLAVGDGGGSSGGGETTLWNITGKGSSRRLGQPLSAPDDGAVDAVAFSPDGRTLAVGDGVSGSGGGGETTLWNITKSGTAQKLGQPLSTTDSGAVDAVAFSPDGRTLAVGDGYGETTLWNITKSGTAQKLGQPLITPDDAAVHAVAFSPDGRTLAVGGSSGGGETTLWNITGKGSSLRLGQPLSVPDSGAVDAVAFSPDGRTLAVGVSGSGGGGVTTLWNITKSGTAQKLGQPLSTTDSGAVDAVAFSPDGRTLAVGDDGIVGSGGGGETTLWNITEQGSSLRLGQPLSVPDSGAVDAVAFSPDGRTLAVGDDGVTTLWNITKSGTAQKLGQPLSAPDSGAVDAVAFSPDGRTLAVGGGGGVTTLWNITKSGTAQKLGQPLSAPDSGAVDAVAFSPDGRTLAVGDGGGSSGGGVMTLWNITGKGSSLRLGQPLSAPDSGAVDAVAFSPDGRTLAVGDGYGETTLWNITKSGTAQKLGQPLSAPDDGAVHAVAFSPDGRTLAVGDGGSSGETTLWNITSLDSPQRISPQFETGNAAENAAFDPDGKFLAVSSGDSLLIWDRDVEDVISRICKFGSGSLTRQQWLQYAPQSQSIPSCPSEP